MSNRLFCTFTTEENLQDLIDNININYNILFSKIFVLSIQDSEELVCTYNIDNINLSENRLIDNTILVHRRKETNTLYTINALNTLIIQLNNGILDKNYTINWLDYKNSILLVRGRVFHKLQTKIFDIIDLNINDKTAE